jgi:hypothetical protein
MEISGPAQVPTSSSIRESQATGQLASIRALQKALEKAKSEMEQPAIKQEGKGQLLDIRC